VSRAGLVAVVACGALVVAAPAPAQIINVQAGSSTLQQSEGGALSIRDDGYEGSIGFESLSPLHLGAYLRTQFRGADLSLGDQTVPFGLPTDLFSMGHSFLGRGFGVRYRDEEVSLLAMGGTTATGFATPYSFGARSDDPVGLVFLEGRVSSTLHVSSRSLYSGGMTSLFGAEWTPRADFGAALAGGEGADQGYFAASSRFERGPFALRAAYALSGSGFRRVVIPRPDASETDRENVEIAFRPRSGPSLTAARNNYVQPGPGGARGTGTVNQLTASGVVRGVAANAAFLLSRAPGSGGTGVSLSLGRGLGRLLRVQGSALRSDPRNGDPTTMWVGSVTEAVSPRLDLTQLATRSAGNTTVSFGGNLLLDRVTLGAEVQTIYVPFAASDAFRQALMLHARVQGPGGIQANLGSYVGPDGVVRYTAYASQYFYGGSKGPPSEEPHFYSNLIRGRVQDLTGNPVSGAALHIDKEVVFTDSRGEFFLRVKKRKEYPFQVAPGEFLVPGRYDVVFAPSSVEAQPEDQAGEVLVVVQHVGDATPSTPAAPETPKPAR
jgi:hypothetical protein